MDALWIHALGQVMGGWLMDANIWTKKSRCIKRRATIPAPQVLMARLTKVLLITYLATRRVSTLRILLSYEGWPNVLVDSQKSHISVG